MIKPQVIPFYLSVVGELVTDYLNGSGLWAWPSTKGLGHIGHHSWCLSDTTFPCWPDGSCLEPIKNISRRNVLPFLSTSFAWKAAGKFLDSAKRSFEYLRYSKRPCAPNVGRHKCASPFSPNNVWRRHTLPSDERTFRPPIGTSLFGNSSISISILVIGQY